MAFSVLASDLFEAVRILNLAPSESGKSSSDFFRVLPSNKGILVNVSGSVVAEVSVQGSGKWPIQEEFYIPRNLFSDWVNEAKKLSNQAVFDFDFRDKLIVRNGTREQSFSVYSNVPGYVDLPKLSGSKLEIGPQLIKLLECAAECATSEKQNPIYACVYITRQKDTVEFVATNQPTIIRVAVQCPDFEVAAKEPVILPINMMNVLKADGLKSIHWTDQSVVAKFSNGTVWHPLLEQATEFPAKEMRDVVTTMSKEKLLCKLKLGKLAAMLGSFSNYLSSVRTLDWKMIVVGKKGASHLQVGVKLPYCTLREKLVCELVKEDFRFVWPVDLVAPVLTALEKIEGDQSLEIRLSANGEATYVRCAGVELVVSTQEERKREAIDEAA